jgi:sterol 3beta-glucosyltransferase
MVAFDSGVEKNISTFIQFIFFISLPILTLQSYRFAAEHEPDLSALKTGLVPRRVLAESLVSILYAISWCITILAKKESLVFGIDSSNVFYSAANGWPSWLRLICALCTLYAAVLFRTLSDFSEPESLFPPSQFRELRRTRYTWFQSRLRVRLFPLRIWWLFLGAMHALLNLIPRIQLSCVGLQTIDSCVAVILSRVMSPHTTLALHFALIMLDVAPIALLLLSLYTLLKCDSRDFSGRETSRQAQWIWPNHYMAGELPGQTPPDRLLSQKRTTQQASAVLARVLVNSSMREIIGNDITGHEILQAEAIEAAKLSIQRLPHLFRPMRIVLFTVGTRGDVQPFIALGLHFIEHGHVFVIATSRNFKDVIEAAGVEFYDIGTGQIQQPEAWTRIKSTSEMIRVTAPTLLRDYPTVSEAFMNACISPARADLVIGTGHTLTFALNVSEGLGIPCWFTKLAPEMVSAGAGMPGQAMSSFGWLNELNALLYWIRVAIAADQAGVTEAELVFRKKDLNLDKFSVSSRIDDLNFTPQLLGFSKHLFPKPTDYPRHAFQCGFWLTGDNDTQGIVDEDDDDEEEEDKLTTSFNEGQQGMSSPRSISRQPRVPSAVRDFIESADPETNNKLPLAVVTFGSMINSGGRRADLLNDIVSEILKRKMRVLVLSGWTDKNETEKQLSYLSDQNKGRVFVWDEAPHEYVFPHAYFVVHHGGAGTTARALSCGIAMVVIPVLRWADQSLYGELVETLGVGVLVREESPSVYAIQDAIRRVLEGGPHVVHHTRSSMCEAANRIGASMRAERASEVALALLESCLCRMVLPEEELMKIQPRLAVLNEGLGGGLRPLPEWETLSKLQKMCVRHCVVCRRIRAEGACIPPSTSTSISQVHSENDNNSHSIDSSITTNTDNQHDESQKVSSSRKRKSRRSSSGVS